MAVVVPNDGDTGRVATQGAVHKHVAARGLCSVPVSIWLEYPGTWQPTWNDREQDLGYPVASSGAGGVRARDRRWTCPVDASTSQGMSSVGLKRLSKPVAKKHPLTARMLRGMFSLLDISQSGHQLVWGLLLILIGYFFLLRRGEFLKVDDKWEKYVLLFGDAQFYDETRGLAKHDGQQWWELFCAEGGTISLDGMR